MASDGLLTDLVGTANSSVPIGQNFSAFLDTFTKTQGFQNLMDFIYNSVGSTNGIDAFGHIVRSNLQLTSCVEVAVTVQSGCEAFFRPATTTPTTTKKKGKKSARKVRGASSLEAAAAAGRRPGPEPAAAAGQPRSGRSVRRVGLRGGLWDDDDHPDPDHAHP